MKLKAYKPHTATEKKSETGFKGKNTWYLSDLQILKAWTLRDDFDLNVKSGYSMRADFIFPVVFNVVWHKMYVVCFRIVFTSE